MNTFEVTLYGRKNPTFVKADTLGYGDDWVTFYDQTVASGVKIVAIFSATDVLCVIRKDER